MKEIRMNKPAVASSSLKYFHRAVLVTLFMTTTPALFAAPAGSLRSPWDGKHIAATEAVYACPTIAHIAPDLVTDGFYRLDDPTHSIIDPVRQEAYRKSSDGVKNVGLAIVKAADDYRTTGSRSAAQCAMTQILTLAQEHSLAGKMSSSQAYYVQGWVVGAIAIAYLKIREADLATTQQTETITQWLLSVGDQTRDYYDAHKKTGKGDSGNNHLYWAGVELAAIGVAANNRKGFDWAMAAYDNGVEQIQPDGSLPLEMARGGSGLTLSSLCPCASRPACRVWRSQSSRSLCPRKRGDSSARQLLDLWSRGPYAVYQSDWRATGNPKNSQRRSDWLGSSLCKALSRSSLGTPRKGRPQSKCLLSGWSPSRLAASG
jgi:hypothetical protein